MIINRGIKALATRGEGEKYSYFKGFIKTLLFP
jgi:hypothetical protein